MGDQKGLRAAFFKELSNKPGDFLMAKKQELAAEDRGKDEDYGVSPGLPFDGRFPYQDQTKHCLMNFIDFHRCLKKYGDDYEPCKYFEKFYRTSCPEKWVEKWSDEVDNGTFAMKF